METEGVEPSLQRCERRVLPLSLRPQALPALARLRRPPRPFKGDLARSGRPAQEHNMCEGERGESNPLEPDPQSGAAPFGFVRHDLLFASERIELSPVGYRPTARTTEPRGGSTLLAPEEGLEPPAIALTGRRSTFELLWNEDQSGRLESNQLILAPKASGSSNALLPVFG